MEKSDPGSDRFLGAIDCLVPKPQKVCGASEKEVDKRERRKTDSRGENLGQMYGGTVVQMEAIAGHVFKVTLL